MFGLIQMSTWWLVGGRYCFCDKPQWLSLVSILSGFSCWFTPIFLYMIFLFGLHWRMCEFVTYSCRSAFHTPPFSSFSLGGEKKNKSKVDIGGFVGDYPERKGDSHFCLVPAGTSPWTNHLYESFYAGCIPVILSDEYELAFMNDLPWEKFSIKWPESLVCDDEECNTSSLYEYLRALAEEHQKLWHMKRELELHSCYFNWYSTDKTCTPYALLHKHLKSLAERRGSQRNQLRYWNSELAFKNLDQDFAHLSRQTRFKHFEDESSFLWLEKKTLVEEEKKAARKQKRCCWNYDMNMCQWNSTRCFWLILSRHYDLYVKSQDFMIQQTLVQNVCRNYPLANSNHIQCPSF